MASAQSLKDNLVRKALRATAAASVEFRTQLREDTPKSEPGGGRTSRGWFTTPPVFTGTSIEFRIRHPQDGSSREKSPRPEWLSQGTAPHEIRVKNAKFLVFSSVLYPSPGVLVPTKTGNPLVFTKRVMHPGFAGTGFIERILGEANTSEVFRRAFAQA